MATEKNGRVQKSMPPWKNVLDEEAINKIGAYLETLAQPGAYWLLCLLALGLFA